MKARIVTTLAFAGWLVPAGALAQGTSCTDGVDCFCDRMASDASVLFCEDFEDPRLNDNVGAGWTDKYGWGSEGCIDRAQVPSVTVEGPYSNSCLNIVTEGACDAHGGDPGTDCVLDGSQSLGLIYNPGRHGGFMGSGQGTTWSRPTNGNLSVTYAIKYSTNFLEHSSPAGPANKTHEFSSTTGNAERHCMLGCGAWSSGSVYKSNPAAGSFDWLGDGAYPYASAFPEIMRISGRFDSASIYRGLAYQTNSNFGFAPQEDYAPNNSKGAWHCRQVHVAGWGTSQTRMREWWDGKLVIDVANWNSTNVNKNNLPFGVVEWNNYYNGGDGRGTGYATDASGNVALNATRAYQYNDNFVISSGSEPISCAAIGFSNVGSGGGSGGTSGGGTSGGTGSGGGSSGGSGSGGGTSGGGSGQATLTVTVTAEGTSLRVTSELTGGTGPFQFLFDCGNDGGWDGVVNTSQSAASHVCPAGIGTIRAWAWDQTAGFTLEDTVSASAQGLGAPGRPSLIQ